MSNHLTRRNACKILAGTPALAGLLEAASDGNMFLALNSVLVSGRVPWPQFADLAATVGFPGTDVMLKGAMEAGAEATNRLLHKLNVRPGAINFPVEFRKDEATFKAGLTELEASAPFAAAIHCPRMVTYIMSSSDTPKDELRRIYKRRFTECARILARSDVRLGLEFLGPLEFRKKFRYEFIWRMPDMLEFAKECGPNVGLRVDTWHWYWAGATTEDLVRAGRERIVHIHFNDAPKETPEEAHDNE
ncbi:MAG: sugar phosphate isomerase/epimerase family protein, partial [Bryobacteraceae bacterium]